MEFKERKIQCGEKIKDDVAVFYLVEWLVVPFTIIGDKKGELDWDITVFGLGQDEFGVLMI